MEQVLEAFANIHRIEPSRAVQLNTLVARKFRPEQIRTAFIVRLRTDFGNTHEMLMVVPRSYPIRPPVLYLLTHIPGPYRMAHIYADDGRCCLFEKIGRDWDPKECNLITAVGWGAMWLFCQEFFQRKGYWPAPESHKTKPMRRTQPWDAKKRK